jgi:hypothetical protein
VRVDLHDGERAAQRVEQPVTDARADGVFAAQPDDQLAGTRARGDGSANRCHRGRRVIRQVERRQRMHAVLQRRRQIILTVVQFHLLRRADDRAWASRCAAAVADGRLERDRLHQHAGAVECAKFRL